MVSAKVIAIRIGGLAFGLTVGVAWIIVGVLPMLVCLLVCREDVAENAFAIWMLPIGIAGQWMTYGDSA